MALAATLGVLPPTPGWHLNRDLRRLSGHGQAPYPPLLRCVVPGPPAWQHPAFDPPGISWNIGINDHTKVLNMTAAQSICTVYFRPAPGHDAEALIERSRKAAAQCGIDFEVLWAGQPLYMDPESDFVREVLALSGNEKAQTVSYGTDGAVLTEMKKLVVLGPGDIAQAHTQDEWILLDQLEKGTQLYAKLIRHWCA